MQLLLQLYCVPTRLLRGPVHLHADRANTMQSRISPKIRQPGKPSAATTIAPSANGNANTVCENRMNVRNREKEDKGENMEIRNSGKRD